MGKQNRLLIILSFFLLLILCHCQSETAASQPLVEAPVELGFLAETPVVAVILPTRTSIPSLTASPASTSTPSITPTPSPEPSITPSTSLLQIPRLDLSPGNPIPYLETFRLVTYYGSPTGRGLGILGDYNRDYMTWELQQLALQYQALSPERFVLPTYHMVTTVADDFPGADENYSHWVFLETIEEWVTAANENGLACVLDIQPGHADIQDEFDRIKHLLEYPHVHLALDPEFVMGEGQIPGQSLGQVSAGQINDLQARMNDIALQIGINRVLIIHQFEDYMLPDKDALEDYPHVDLVINADGVSDTWNKLYDYKQYVLEPNFEYAGIKIFYYRDTLPLLSPEELMWLEPPPAVIIYQ